jgi:hypothetical protein
VETVLYEPLVAALPDEHLLAVKPQVALEDLAEAPSSSSRVGRARAATI